MKTAKVLCGGCKEMRKAHFTNIHFVFRGFNYKWVDPAKLGRGVIDSRDEKGYRYGEELAISDAEYRAEYPTLAKIEVEEIETGNLIKITDDYGNEHVVTQYGVFDVWMEIFLESAKENQLWKPAAKE